MTEDAVFVRTLVKLISTATTKGDMMSGGAGSVVEWTNRSVHLAEGAAHLMHLGGTAGRLAKQLPCLGVVTGASQAGFFYTQAAREFAKPPGDRDHGWEAVGGCLYR